MTRTRAGGVFEVKRIPEGVEGWIEVTPLPSDLPLLAAERNHVEAGASGLLFELALGVRIEGTATDESGRALGGVTIVARPLPVGTEPEAGARYWVHLPPDETSFAVGPLPAGRYELAVQPLPGFDPGPPRTVEAPVRGVQILLRQR